MDRRVLRVLMIGLVMCFPGCGKPPMQTVTGVVQLDGKPLPNCKVAFYPDVEQFNPDRHGVGYGMSDADGKFTIQHPQGEAGIWAGKYKVMFEAWVDSKGNALPPTAKPSEVPGGVKNLLPDEYRSPSSTPETATVKSGANEFTFNIASKK